MKFISPSATASMKGIRLFSRRSQQRFGVRPSCANAFCAQRLHPIELLRIFAAKGGMRPEGAHAEKAAVPGVTGRPQASMKRA